MRNFAKLVAAVLVALTFAATTSAQDGSIDQARYETERRIQAEIEQLRQLHSEGRYQEVISHAQTLLGIDPANTAARVWMDRAQEKLDRVETEFPQNSRPVYDLVEPEVIETPPVEEPTAAEAEIEYTPVPLAPRKRQSGLAGGLPPMLLIGLAVVAVLFVIVALIAWLKVRASQRQLSDAIEEAEKKRAVSDEPSFSDRPTSVHDAVTQVQGVSAPPSHDEDSVMQFGEVGVSDETGEDVNGYRSGSAAAGEADMSTRHDDIGQQSTQVQGAQETTQMESPEQEQTESFALDSEAEESLRLDDPEQKFSSSILGAPPPEEAPTQSFSQQPQQEDEGEVTYNSMMFGNQEETVLPGGGPQADQSQAPEGDELSFSSMMFSGASETKSPGDETEEKTGVEPEQNDEMTFNSLMFSGADETQLPGQPPQETGVPPAQGPPPESPAQDEGDMTFNSMMFGGNEETVAPPGMGQSFEGAVDQNVPLSGGLGADEGESTNIVPGMTGDGDETIRLEGEGTELGSTAGKFEAEKQAGLGALSNGDYKTAVQALSVAAGLRPDDNEVAEKLAEARQRRDAQS